MSDTVLKVVLAGGSGFIGSYLTSFLVDKGYHVAVLTRDPQLSATQDNVSYVLWDGRNDGEWSSVLEGAEAVVNMSGRNINCRLTKANKRSVLESRVKSAEVLLDAMSRCSVAPKAFIQCSAVGYYGNTTKECDESAARGAGFLSDVCAQLEDVVNKSSLPSTRKNVLRLGVVLGCGGGAYPVLAGLTKYFMGGALGPGNQYVSWIHINDVCRIIERCVSDAAMAGVYNAVAPCAITNSEFMSSFRMNFKRPWSPKVPALLVKVGTFIIGSNSQILLEGQNVLPCRLLDSDFEFKYPDINSALKDLEKI